MRGPHPKKLSKKALDSLSTVLYLLEPVKEVVSVGFGVPPMAIKGFLLSLSLTLFIAGPCPLPLPLDAAVGSGLLALGMAGSSPFPLPLEDALA